MLQHHLSLPPDTVARMGMLTKILQEMRREKMKMDNPNDGEIFTSTKSTQEAADDANELEKVGIDPGQF